MINILLMICISFIYLVSAYFDFMYFIPLTFIACFHFTSDRKVYETSLLVVIICLSFGRYLWLMNTVAFVLIYLYIKKMRTLYNQLSNQMRKKLDHDSLSGLYNNRYILDYLDNRLKNVNKEPLAVLLMDIDGFRRINERFGHAYGDLLISEIAKLLTGLTNDSDVLGRYGGEEFILILNNGSLERSINIADRIKQGIEEMPIKDNMRITMSIGIAFNDKDTAKGLIKKADQQLIQAKKLGKGDFK